MTPERAKDIRIAAGLTLTEAARLYGLSDPERNGADRVREYERGKVPISGPVARIMQFLEAEYLGDPFLAMDLE